MPISGFTDKLKRLGRDYLFQTTINEQQKNINCSLFNAGQLINNRIIAYPQDLLGAELMEKVHYIHKQNFADIDSLLGLAERMRKLEKPEIIEKLGKTLYSKDLYDEGIELLVLAAQKYSESPGLHFVLGRLYLGKGVYDEAEIELHKAVELAPNFPDYRNLLGVAYLKLKKSLAAIKEFNKAVELNIYFDKAYFNLGLAFIGNGLYREDYNLAKNLVKNSMDSFEKAILFNPSYETQDYFNGLIALKQGDLQAAFSLLSSVADLNTVLTSEDRLLEMYLRYVHDEAGMTEDGIKRYIERISELLKTNSGYADLHNELGMAYTVMSKFMNDKAIMHFQAALKINPNFAKATRNLKLSQNDLKGFEILLEAIVK